MWPNNLLTVFTVKGITKCSKLQHKLYSCFDFTAPSTSKLLHPLINCPKQLITSLYPHAPTQLHHPHPPTKKKRAPTTATLSCYHRCLPETVSPATGPWKTKFYLLSFITCHQFVWRGFVCCLRTLADSLLGKTQHCLKSNNISKHFDHFFN